MTYRWCFTVAVCHALVFRKVRVPAPYWPSTRCVQVVHKTPVGFQHKLRSDDLISLFLTVSLHTLITWTAFRTVRMMFSTGLHLTDFIFAHPDVFFKCSLWSFTCRMLVCATCLAHTELTFFSPRRWPILTHHDVWLWISMQRQDFQLCSPPLSLQQVWFLSLKRKRTACIQRFCCSRMLWIVGHYSCNL